MHARTPGFEEEKIKIDPAVVKFDRCTREPGSWKEEIIEGARLIANKATKPIWVCASGGVGSEVICQAFFDQGIHFQVLVAEQTTGVNAQEVAYAKKWCRQHDVEMKTMYLDMSNFLEHDIERYMKEGYEGGVNRFFQLKLLEEVERMGGYAVFGGGQQLYVFDQEKQETCLSFDAGYSVPMQWCKNNNTAHEPYFYFSTPELILSYLQIPIIDAAVNRAGEIFTGHNNAQLLRRIVYQALWPALEPRAKHTGFTDVRPLLAKAQAALTERLGSKATPYRIPVSQVLKQLLPESA